LNVSDTIRKFYVAANTIAYCTRRVNEMAQLSLFESFTFPMLCYGCECTNGSLLKVSSGTARGLIAYVLFTIEG